MGRRRDRTIGVVTQCRWTFDGVSTQLTTDGVEDFDAVTLDPSTGNMLAEFLPNSTFTQLPWDYLHPNHAGYIAMGEAVDIQPFAPSHHP